MRLSLIHKKLKCFGIGSNFALNNWQNILHSKPKGNQGTKWNILSVNPSRHLETFIKSHYHAMGSIPNSLVVPVKNQISFVFKLVDLKVLRLFKA